MQLLKGRKWATKVFINTDVGGKKVQTEGHLEAL